MSSPLADSAYGPLALEMESEGDAWLQSRDEERRRDMAERARAQGGDREAEAVADALDVHTAFRAGDGPPAQVVGLDTALSNAALADTPAVREMGGPARASITCDRCGKPCEPGLEAWAARHAACSPTLSLPPDAIVLTGPDAARYRDLQAAARRAQQSATAARADGAALLQLFQAFCAGVAP